MDCNKEEAIRFKGVAEKKMQAKDFAGAYKLAMKAQQLDAGMDNVSQMLMVCKVHCAAQQKLLGNEMDWYGILQLQQTADEVAIKKQYKKFALQLHPDKNKFPGAEAAFKLIGEAQALLLDKGKRSLHDVKRRASVHNPVPPYKYQPGGTYSTNMNFGVQNNARGNFTGVNLQDPRPQQPGLPTFWTMCPFCTIKQQRFIDIINKIVICSVCNKTFFAYQSMPGAPPVSNSNQSTFPKRKDVSGPGPGPSDCNVESRSQRNFKPEHLKSENSTVKVNGKRRRKHEDSSSSDSSSDSSDDSSDSNEEVPTEEDADFKADVDVQGSTDRPRRSTRSKQQVSYKENLSDDSGDNKESSSDDDDDEVEDHSTTGNRWKEESPEMKEPSGMAADVTVQEEAKDKVTSGSTSPSSSSSKRSQDPEPLTCPDPEFHDFDLQRNESCFSQGQIWALYDDLDAMPRFYARIMKVSSPGFKLEITWLEPSPDDEDEREWVRDDSPAACGKFKHGEKADVESRDMFSHLVIEKGGRRSTYKILPRKGEIWALFRNCEAIGRSGDDASRNDYEFAEILSDFAEDEGAYVAFLDKMTGFVSLFCHPDENNMVEVQIPADELSRFSHMVPFFRMTGEERDGVPRGSFELDPAALPPTC